MKSNATVEVIESVLCPICRELVRQMEIDRRIEQIADALVAETKIRTAGLRGNDRAWTIEDTCMLLGYLGNGDDRKEVAYKLGRTTAAVGARLDRMTWTKYRRTRFTHAS